MSARVEGYRVDWMALLLRVRAVTGRPLAAIGREVGMEERTINKLARGEVSEPRLSQGLALLDLAVDALGAEAVQAYRAGSRAQMTKPVARANRDGLLLASYKGVLQ